MVLFLRGLDGERCLRPWLRFVPYLYRVVRGLGRGGLLTRLGWGELLARS